MLPASPVSSGAPAGALPAVALAPLPSPRALHAHEVRKAIDFRSALERLRAQVDAHSPTLVALTEEVRVVCAVVRRPDASARQVETDPNRRAWIDALMRRCAGLLDSDLQPAVLLGESLKAWNQQLPEWIAVQSMPAGLALAKQQLADSADPRILIAALRFLLEHDELPLRQIYAGASPARSDIEAALLAAADWIACSRSASCDAEGLWTLYTCAQFGCPPGSDLPRALYRILPAYQFEAAQHLVRWVITTPAH